MVAGVASRAVETPDGWECEMKSLQEAIEAVTMKGPHGSCGTKDVQDALSDRLAQYDWIPRDMAHMRSVRDMLEEMWQAMLAKRVTPKDAFLSLLANGVMIGIEMAKEDKPKLELVN